MMGNNVKNTAEASERETPENRWIINPDLCTGCGECVDACLHSLLVIVKKKVILKDETVCPECGDCAGVCVTKAITFV